MRVADRARRRVPRLVRWRGCAAAPRTARVKAARFQLEAALVRAVAAVRRRCCRWRRCARAATASAGVMYWVDGFHRRIALENLAHAFPSRRPAERRALAKAMFAHFGGLLLELLKFGTPVARARCSRLIEVEGEERVRQRVQAGPRRLLLHRPLRLLGDAGDRPAASMRRRSSVLARPLDNPRLHDLLERIRTTTGNRVIYRQGAIRKRAARAGRQPRRGAS